MDSFCSIFLPSQSVYVITELCEGGNLSQAVRSYGPLPEPQAAAVCRSLADALRHCHARGIMHRDVKPENIALARDSVDAPVKLLDFGLATFFSPGE